MAHGDEPHSVHLFGIPFKVRDIRWNEHGVDAPVLKCITKLQPDLIQKIIKNVGGVGVDNGIFRLD